MAIALATGAFLLAVGVMAGIWIGRVIADPTSEQERQSIRELMTVRKNLLRQIDSAHDHVQRIAMDPTTRPDTRQRLEERVLPRLTQRKRE